jgi:hypothetical protein
VSGIPWSHPQQQHQNHTQKPLTCALKLSFTPIYDRHAGPEVLCYALAIYHISLIQIIDAMSFFAFFFLKKMDVVSRLRTLNTPTMSLTNCSTPMRL